MNCSEYIAQQVSKYSTNYSLALSDNIFKLQYKGKVLKSWWYQALKHDEDESAV